jgi:nucleoside 2-deoxyribosyltransferase
VARVATRDAKSVYVASPLGFTGEGRHYLKTVILPQLRERGFVVLDPWEEDGGLLGAHELGRRNVDLIERADAVLALLNGPDVDSGTAAEIGYAYARGCPVVGWRDDFRQAGESEETPVNLQVAYFVRKSGGRIEPSLDQAVAALGDVLA